MERNRLSLLLGLAVALVAVVGVAIFFVLRPTDPVGPVGDGVVEREGPTDAELIAKKLENRRERSNDAPDVGLRGEVREAGSMAPVAGALVAVSSGSVSSGPGVGRPRKPTFAVTEKDGSWSLPGVKPGKYAISASAKGYLPAFDDALTVKVGGVEPVVLELVPGGLPLTGTVSDYGGGGIGGVLIRVQPTGWATGQGRETPRFLALTDDDGRYEIFVPDREVRVFTWHDDYISKSATVKMKGQPQTKDFELLPGGSIAGVVMDATTGKPVVGAQVHSSVSRGGSFNFGFGAGGSVATDDEGRFELRQLEAGVHQLRARAPALATVAPVEVPLGIGEQVADVEVPMAPAVDVSGFVVLADDHEKGVPGVQVMLFSMMQGGQYVAERRTEDDGYFVIHGVAPGSYMLTKEGPGLVQEKGFGGMKQVEVKDASIDDLLVEVRQGVEIRGTVSPPRSAKLRLEDPDEKGGGMIQVSMGGGAGRGPRRTMGRSWSMGSGPASGNSSRTQGRPRASSRSTCPTTASRGWRSSWRPWARPAGRSWMLRERASPT